MLTKVLTLAAIIAVALVMLRLIAPKNRVRVSRRPALRGPRRRRARVEDATRCEICGAFRTKDDLCDCGRAPTP